MRWSLSVLFSVLIIALLVCLVLTKKSNKAIRNRVAFLLAGVTLPVLGNLIIILATTRLPANIGYYTYFIGMDIAVYSVWYFTYAYCDFGKPKLAIKMLIHSLIAIDLIQYMTNPFLKLSFSTEMILVDNRIYFRLVPHIGQAYHRIVCYGIFLAILIVFLVKGIKTERIYAERYWIMFLAGAITGAVESYYIFSRKPVDMSMIGFGLYGLLVFFFALHYRPMKLLDRMLAGFASKTSEALFFFGKDGKCVWINEPGRKLIGVSQNDYDSVNENLTFLFGDIDFKSTGWVKKITLGTGDEAMYTYLTMNSLVDEKGNITGSCLSVRDITEDQREMKREIYNSTHDSITGLYTREYLFEQIEKRLREDKDTHYMIGYMEISNLKVINDVFGRDFAELTLKRAAEFIKEGVGNKCLYGRLSDDSFGILIDKVDFDNKPVDEKIANFTVSDNNLEHRVLLHYGIYDISKGKSTVAVIDPFGAIVKSPFEIRHTSSDLKKLTGLLKSLDGETRIVMEYTGIYYQPVARFLSESGLFVSVVHAKILHDFANNSIRRIKTDKADAVKIANYGLLNWDSLKPYTKEDDTRLLLKSTNRQYYYFLKLYVAAKNNLIAVIDQTCPGLNDLFTSPRREDGHIKWVDVAIRFWHCECITDYSLNKFTELYNDWCKKNRYVRSKSKAEELYKLAKECVPTLPKNESTKFIVRRAAEELLTISEALGALQKELIRLAEQLPEYPIVMSFTGVGKILGPQLMAEIGDVRRFRKKACLVAFAGVDAPPFQSGKFDSKSRHISKKGSCELRKTLFQIVTVLLQNTLVYDPVYQFIDRKRQEGKPYYVYMVAGCNKFLRIYYARVKEYLETQEAA